MTSVRVYDDEFNAFPIKIKLQQESALSTYIILSP
jgi:hypothetical protein